ncbi:RrF2 family transcriptional regulator [Sulfurovum sp. CS9]|uniref:RrF2 family transcriptional regulator n=1 Tax=Sulfurovum sp. CS9 TaxID=3391146 RepID=UPI0039EB6958
MQLSNTSQYAIRILAYMADKKDSQLNATELAEILYIPYKFLTKIMTDLVKVDLVESIRGREGGYKLKKKSSDIMVGDILDVFNDSIKDEQCVLGIGFCNGMCKCALHDQWMEPKLLLQKMFRESSLEDIAGRGCKI